MRKKQSIFFGWWVLIAIGYSLFVGAGMIFYAMSVLLEACLKQDRHSIKNHTGTDKQAVSNGDQHPPAEENTLFFAHQTSCPFG